MSEICPNCGAGLWGWYFNALDCPNCRWSNEKSAPKYWAMAINKRYYLVNGIRAAKLSGKICYEPEPCWFTEEQEAIFKGGKK